MTAQGASPGRRPVALSIAGSDSSGGAGIAADLKTFQAHGCWGTVAVTAVTAQNTLGVQVSEAIAPEIVAAQIASVVADLGVDAAKTGMLGTAGVVEALASTIGRFGISRLVVDPVMMSSRGDVLLEPSAIDALRSLLVPLAALVTPNLDEAAALTGRSYSGPDGLAVAARHMVGAGATAVLVTGGDLGGDVSQDCFWSAELEESGGEPIWLSAPRVPGNNTHGTGCVLSAAICAGLANGLDVLEACRVAKDFVTRAIAAGVPLGEGPGSLDPAAARDR